MLGAGLLTSSCATLFTKSRQEIQFKGVPGTVVIDKKKNQPIAEIGSNGFARAEILHGEMPPFYNIFEDAVLPMCEGARKARTLLAQMGAEALLMSGSGPSVFALSKNPDLAKEMRDALISAGFHAVRFSF